MEVDSRYRPETISIKRRKVFEFIIDETQIKVGSHYFWLWVGIKSIHKTIVDIHFSAERYI
jgi:transposase-like protein